MELSVAFPSAGVIRLRSPHLFANPDNPTCRTFLERVFQAEEVSNVTIKGGEAELRYCPRHVLSQAGGQSGCRLPEGPACARACADRGSEPGTRLRARLDRRARTRQGPRPGKRQCLGQRGRDGQRPRGGQRARALGDPPALVGERSPTRDPLDERNA